MTDQFVDYVSALHAAKHEVYGDSWKRRGEAVAILANIARKIDRLGIAGAGDTSADTAVDLLVYLLKYRLWVAVHLGEKPPRPFRWDMLPTDEGPEQVDCLLVELPLMRSDADVLAPKLIKDDQEMFERLLATQAAGGSRYLMLDHMILVTNQLARHLWTEEQ